VNVAIISSGKEKGFGSAAPVKYVTGETVESVVSTIESRSSFLSGMECGESLSPFLIKADELFADSPAAKTAMQMAVMDLWAKENKINLLSYFGSKSAQIESDITLSITSPHEASRIAKEAASDGFRIFKIKTGGPDGVEADMERIRAVANAVPNCKLRIDANQAYEAEEAVDFVKRASSEFDKLLELIEQPVDKADWEALKYVRSRSHVPIFADECAQSPDDVRKLIERECVDGINIKLMKSGIPEALKIVSICSKAGASLMLGCMLESRLSLTAAVYLAAGTGAFSYFDLDAYRLTAPEAQQQGGFIDKGPILTVDTSNFGWGWN
jgi:L-alanine-DL-glutamate epimerase-like enolase superfamily enzyme